MKKILIIGDSHTQKLSYCIDNVIIKNIHNEKYVYSEQQYRSMYQNKNNEYSRMHDSLFLFKNDNVELYISGHPGRSALNFNYDEFGSGAQKEILNLSIDKSFTVMPWLGYIDIRNWIPQKNINSYKNSKEVVKIYVDNTLKKFSNNKVIFIEPLPQFITYITSRWMNFSSDPANEFEERYQSHLDFVQELKEYCLELNLPEPISPSKILDTDMIETYMQPKKPIKLFLNDHMTEEYYEKILFSILKLED
jgi:hypothetical protein